MLNHSRLISNKQNKVYLKHWTTVRRAFFDFGIVLGTFSKHRFIVIHVSDEDNYDRGTGMYGRRTVDTTSAIVHSSNVQLIFISFQRYRFRVQTDHTGNLFYDKLTGRCAASNEPKSETRNEEKN